MFAKKARMNNVYKIDGTDIKRMFIESVKYIKNHEGVINKINVFPVPDGDTGTNLFFTLSSVSNDIKDANIREVDKMLELISTSSLLNSRGNSGIIISQFFNGLYEKAKGKRVLSAEDFANALKKGEEYAYKALNPPKEGTILSVIKGAISRVKNAVTEKKDFIYILKEAWKGAVDSLKKTKNQMELLKKSNVVDAGGLGFVYILEGWMIAFNLKPEKIEFNNQPNKVDVEIKYKYCTEFLLKGHTTVGKLAEDLKKIGNCVEVGKINGYIKVHVHTNNPDLAQKICMKYGIIMMIKVDDMKILHNHMLFSKSRKL